MPRVVTKAMLWAVAACMIVVAPAIRADDSTIIRLPPVIKSTLDQEYPGWKYAPVNAQVQQEFLKHQVGHPPSLVWGDFNNDGKRDYAVQVARTTPGQEEQFICVFLQSASGYDETIVESRGLDPAIYLWTRKKLMPSEDNAGTMQDLLVVMGGITGETAYHYENGNFHELQESDGAIATTVP